MKVVLVYVIGLIVAIAIAVGSFFVYRWFNYSFGYESMVQETVRQMVKPEALKDGR